MKFIHAADIHLDSPLLNLERYEGAPVEEARVSTRLAFRNLIDLAVEEEVDFVIISGDLYDGDWKDYNTGLFFIARMSELREAGIRAFIVSGNHDAANRIHRSLRLPENVRMFSAKAPETAVLEDLGVALHGQSYKTRAVTDNLVTGYPRRQEGMFNIGLLHTAINGREGHEPYAPCTLQQLISMQYDYWALGHVHRPEVVNEYPWVVFPGNIQGRHGREMGARGCMLVRVEGDRVAAVEERELDVLRWVSCEVKASEEDGIDEILDRAETELARLFAREDERLLAVRVVIEGACKGHGRLIDHKEHITSEIRAIAATQGAGRAWVEKVDLHTAMPTEPVPLELDDSMAGFFDAICACRPDGGLLDALAEELSDLQKKLPAALKEGTEYFDPLKPESLRVCIEDAKGLLLERLLQGGEGR